MYQNQDLALFIGLMHFVVLGLVALALYLNKQKKQMC